jgi:high-affinity iron transporter
MLPAALIVFREVLEAALIVTIIMAATRGLPHRGKWVSLGILVGIAGAGIVAALANIIASSFAGSGQEIVNAAILFIAVGLIGWHIVWMNSHGRRMAAEMRAIGHQVAEGEKHMSVLAIVVGLAVMREGSELVLMLKGLWAGSNSSNEMIIGSLIGLAAGVAMGALLYAGMLALSLGRLFSLTNGLLVLIASGMAARGADFLNQADLLPTLKPRMWDTGFILSDDHGVGQALGALIGYIAQPSGIEVLFYGVTAAVIFICIRLTRMHAHGHAKAP